MRAALVWLGVAVVAFPVAIGLFWAVRHDGSAAPLCGDRPGVHYPLCQLPAPWGVGTTPTTKGFTP